MFFELFFHDLISYFHRVSIVHAFRGELLSQFSLVPTLELFPIKDELDMFNWNKQVPGS